MEFKTGTQLKKSNLIEKLISTADPHCTKWKIRKVLDLTCPNGEKGIASIYAYDGVDIGYTLLTNGSGKSWAYVYS